MTTPKGLLLVLMEPPAGLEEEFNDWYDTEHLPQRRSLPGFQSGSRWACVGGWPRWAALYDLVSVAVLDTPDYQAVSGPNATPWSRRILPRTVGRSRIVAGQVLPGDASARPVQEVSQLVLARYRQMVDAAACAQAAASLPGLMQMRMFCTVGPGPAEGWAVAEFDRPQSPGAVRGALGMVAGTGAATLNLYVPYHRG